MHGCLFGALSSVDVFMEAARLVPGVDDDFSCSAAAVSSSTFKALTSSVSK
jgi:hypothetical protein